jgi:hypothetical protein
LHKVFHQKTNTESTPRWCNCAIVEGEKLHPASYRGYSHAKGALQKRRAQRPLEGSSGKTFFYRFISPEQSYATALRQDTQHQQPQTPQRDEKSVRYPQGKEPSKHCVGGWMGTRDSLDTGKKRKYLTPNMNQTLIPQLSSPHPIAIPTEISCPLQ